MKKNEKKLVGIPIVPGKALAEAHFVGRSMAVSTKAAITEQQVGAQIILFNKVREQAKSYYADFADRENTAGTDSPSASILYMYQQILDDPAFIGQVVETISAHLVTLETAIRVVANDFVKRFEAAQTSYFRERSSDIIEICEKLVSLISGNNQRQTLQTPVILIIAGTFTPSDILSYDRAMIKGVVALNAGTTSHASILARTYGIPVVSGIEQLGRLIKRADQALVDGDDGCVYINPTASRIAAFTGERHAQQRLLELQRKWNRTVYSRDGVACDISANVALSEDIAEARALCADGVGLVRTEFLYYMHNRPPSAREQHDYFAALFEAAGDARMVIRLFDIGADKTPKQLNLPRESNPSMGWRGIRILLANHELFREHVTAIMEAGAGRKYSIMMPMVSTFSEWRESREIIAACAADLHQPMPRLGILLEVPLALLEIKNFMREVDFASIGTNDLIQYLNAADRNNPKVNYLYNPVEPAFLRILKSAIAAAREMGKPISICGEMAGFPQYTILLLGLGLTRFSATPRSIPVLKEIVSQTSIAEAIEKVESMFYLPVREMESFVQRLNCMTLGAMHQQLAPFFDAQHF